MLFFKWILIHNQNAIQADVIRNGKDFYLPLQFLSFPTMIQFIYKCWHMFVFPKWFETPILEFSYHWGCECTFIFSQVEKFSTFVENWRYFGVMTNRNKFKWYIDFSTSFQPIWQEHLILVSTLKYIAINATKFFLINTCIKTAICSKNKCVSPLAGYQSKTTWQVSKCAPKMTIYWPKIIFSIIIFKCFL